MKFQGSVGSYRISIRAPSVRAPDGAPRSVWVTVPSGVPADAKRTVRFKASREPVGGAEDAERDPAVEEVSVAAVGLVDDQADDDERDPERHERHGEDAEEEPEDHSARYAEN